MIPGTVGKMTEKTIESATTIRITADVMRLSGTVPVTNVVPALGGNVVQGVLLYSTSGTIAVVETGNVNLGGVATNLTTTNAVRLIYNPKLAKWTL